jgi:hypothetical protein
LSQSPIFNANQRTIGQLAGTLPDVSGAMNDYFQQMTFEVITKTIVNFQVVETTTPVTFQGILVPDSRPLRIQTEGQRSWVPYQLYAQINLELNPDDVVVYQGTQYRVVKMTDYSLYGYLIYSLIQDWTGSGPST